MPRDTARSLACALALLAVACSPGSGTEGEGPCRELRGAPRETHPPVALIVLDSLRRDRTGQAGAAARTPVFDAFAQAHLRFDHAFANAPVTGASVASLLSGLLPSQHGVGMANDGVTPLAPRVVTLAELLRDAGYRTAAFVADAQLGVGSGFEQGFDVFEAAAAGASDAALAERAVTWVASQPADASWLLLVQLAKPDAPNGYDAGVTRQDAALRALLGALEATPGGARAAIVVTSDHGDVLGERAVRGLYDEEIAVPLAMRLPGVVGPPDGGVQCLVALADVAPTLCTYLGVRCPGGLAGQDLLAQRPGRRWIVSEGVAGAPRHRAVRNRRWKLLYQPDGAQGGARATPWSLYDLAVDPGETRDRFADADASVRRVADELTRALEDAGGDATAKVE